MTKDKNKHEQFHHREKDAIPSFDNLPADITLENIEFLKKLIESFNTSTVRLKETYAALQEKFDRLNLKLEETNRDLSESLSEQERLSNYLTNILESLSSGVLVIDTKGEITLFNRGAEALTGITADEAIGRHYSEIMENDIPEELTPVWTLTNRKGRSNMEKTITTRDGRKIPVGFSISPLVNRSDEMFGVVEIFMDLSRIKALEDELSKKEKLAALGQMAATMAHKIRNPLGGIAGFAGLLELQLTDDEDGKRLVGKITEGVDKLDRIVTNLLSYTSLLKLKPRQFNIATEIEKVLNDVRNSLEGKEKEVHFSIESPEGEVTVEVDAEQFREASKIIINNAVEAIENSGTVEIVVIPGESSYSAAQGMSARILDTIRASSGLLKSRIRFGVMTVADTGEGMNSEEKKHLFVPFYTTKENGTGLGLATARKIIEAHHGEIWIESKKGEGTAVGIILPMTYTI